MAETSTGRAAITPSQTVGPFFHIGLDWDDWHEVVGPDQPDAIELVGRVIDGAGDGVPDAVVEIWQADADGRYNHPGDRFDPDGPLGWGRDASDPDGGWRFLTSVPGSVDGQLPHVAVVVFARGLLDHLFTRAYLCDPAELAGQAAAGDSVLAAVPGGLHERLCARRDGDSHGRPVWRFDIRLQGDDATPFLEYDPPDRSHSDPADSGDRDG